MNARFDLDRLSDLRWRQAGVLARWQILERGGTDADIARMRRRRELQPVHPGVYVDHTGPLTRRQREWAAVLALWPAALARESALGWRTRGDLQVAIGPERRVTPPAGIVVHRVTEFDRRVMWPADPPRILVEHAVIDVAAAALRRSDVAGAYAALARARGDRLVSQSRLTDALRSRSRVTDRRLLEEMLEDLGSGADSVLERGYLIRVERAHGLPRGRRQVHSTATGRRTVQDVRYDDFGLIVELDGWADHGSAAARDNDAARDLAELAVTGDLTVRVTYGQVYRDECRTAAHLARILHARGWTGAFTPCPRCPAELHRRIPRTW